MKKKLLMGIIIILLLFSSWLIYSNFNKKEVKNELKEELITGSIIDYKKDKYSDYNIVDIKTYDSKENGNVIYEKNLLGSYNDIITNFTRDGKSCTGNRNLKFEISKGKVIITDLDSNENYTMSNIEGAKELYYLENLACDNDYYYILTNDGKIYYASHLSHLEVDNISEYEQAFKLIETDMIFDRLGVISENIVVAKTDDNKEVFIANEDNIQVLDNFTWMGGYDRNFISTKGELYISLGNDLASKKIKDDFYVNYYFGINNLIIDRQGFLYEYDYSTEELNKIYDNKVSKIGYKDDNYIFIFDNNKMYSVNLLGEKSTYFNFKI